ncbi:MAG: DUF3307 domain-containing protein [Flavobacteriaceae bacterium]
MMLLIKLLLAHVIADFFIQPKSWVAHKEKHKFKSVKLYLHVIVHVVLTALLLWDLSLWPILVIIGLSHFIIDGLKLTLQKKKTKRRLFFIDQILHILVILACFILYGNTPIPSEAFVSKGLLLLLCLMFLTLPTSIVMKTVFTKWNISELTKSHKSLKDAGQYIGILERFLVFVFIVSGHWEAVGFLITAKSVFRFGDLKNSKHRQLTEYILIGTLISFSIAIITALIFNVLTVYV